MVRGVGGHLGVGRQHFLPARMHSTIVSCPITLLYHNHQKTPVTFSSQSPQAILHHTIRTNYQSLIITETGHGHYPNILCEWSSSYPFTYLAPLFNLCCFISYYYPLIESKYWTFVFCCYCRCLSKMEQSVSRLSLLSIVLSLSCSPPFPLPLPLPPVSI